MLSTLLDNCTDLTELSEVFHMLFDANQFGVTVVRADGVIVYYNDAQARLDSLKPEDALGRPVYYVYDFTIEDSPTMRVLRSGKSVLDDVHYYRTRHGKLVNSVNDIYPLWAGERLLGAICFISNYATVSKRDGFPDTRPGPETGHDDPVPLRPMVKSHYSFASLIGESSSLRGAASLAEKAAHNSSAVMLVGETGVGKEIFAQAIHYASPRKDRPYTAVNCAAVPAGLLEGILFGTTRGAFTGAINKAGLFEETNRGTLYLDEVDSMPVSLQSKMLRALQEKQVRRIGEAHEREVDVRIISSVGRNPTAIIEEGRMRSDFYYRLGVVKILIPPLRERMEDLHLLVRHFLSKHSEAIGIPAPLLTPEAMAALYSHKWPGNVRELEHTVEAALTLLEPAGNLELSHLYRACPDIHSPSAIECGTTPWLAYQDHGHDEPTTIPSLTEGRSTTPPAEAAADGLRAARDALEAGAVTKALRSSAGNVALASRLLGLSPQLLHYKLKKYGLNSKSFRPEHL